MVLTQQTSLLLTLSIPKFSSSQLGGLRLPQVVMKN